MNPGLEKTEKTEYTQTENAPPLFLLTAQTLELLPELLLYMEQRQLISCALHELRFSECTHPSAAAIVLWDCPLSKIAELLSLLNAKQAVLNLFFRSLPDRRDWNIVQSNRLLHCYTAFDVERPTPFVFCDTVPQRLDALSARGVHTLLLRAGTRLPSLPNGMCAWFALPFARERREAFSSEAAVCQLPLEKLPLFSDPSLAIPLAVLGGEPRRLEAFLLCADWRPSLDREELFYTLHPRWSGLLAKRVCPSASADILCFLQEGAYLQVRAADGFVPDCVLYGFDLREKVFFGWSPARRNLLVDMQIVDRLCAEPACKSTLLRLSMSDPDDGLSNLYNVFANGFRDDVPCGEPYDGWQASVVFTNLLQTCKTLPAASALTFLEERFVTERQLRLVRQQTGLYLEPLDRFSALLQSEGAECLRQLRDGQESSVPLVYDLFRRLLNVEEACRRAFVAEWTHEQELTAFLRQKIGEM